MPIIKIDLPEEMTLLDLVKGARAMGCELVIDLQPLRSDEAATDELTAAYQLLTANGYKVTSNVAPDPARGVLAPECTECNGDGWISAKENLICPKCEGTGLALRSDEATEPYEPCPHTTIEHGYCARCGMLMP